MIRHGRLGSPKHTTAGTACPAMPPIALPATPVEKPSMRGCRQQNGVATVAIARGQSAAALARARARRERWRPCHRCGKPFQERRADAKFCSNACRQAAYRVTVNGSAACCQTSICNGEPEGDSASLKGAVQGTEGGLPQITTVSSVPLINSQRKSKVRSVPSKNRAKKPKVRKIR